MTDGRMDGSRQGISMLYIFRLDINIAYLRLQTTMQWIMELITAIVLHKRMETGWAAEQEVQ